MLPNYEQAIAQGMKQPPPPYYQVALTTASINSPNGVTETIAIGRIAPPAYSVADDNDVQLPVSLQQQQHQQQLQHATAAEMSPHQPTAQIQSNAPNHTSLNISQYPQV